MTKCLIVDDVEVTRFTTKEILEKLGFDSIAANDSGTALDALKSGDIDFVVLDWHLGKESGLDLLQSIRESYGRLPVIVFSGVESENKSSEAVAAGANAFLAKPTTREKLERCLKSIGINK